MGKIKEIDIVLGNTNKFSRLSIERLKQEKARLENDIETVNARILAYEIKQLEE